MVAQKAARWEALGYLEGSGLIEQRFDLDGTRRQVWLRRGLAADDRYWTGTLLAECMESPEFPTEAFMAQVALGLMAHGVAIPERPVPVEAPGRKYVFDWKEVR